MSRLLPAIFLLCSPVLAAQQGGELTGISPISAGTSGAGVAAGESALDASTNPASLMNLFGSKSRHPSAQQRFEFYGRYVDTQTDITDRHGNSIDATHTAAIGPWFAYAELIHPDVAWSIAFQPTLGADFASTRTTDLNIATVNPDGSGGPMPDDVLMATELMQLALEPSLAWRVDSKWSFGVGLSIRDTSLETSAATELGLSMLQGDIPEGLANVFGDLNWGELIQQLGAERGVDSFQGEFTGEADSGLPTTFLKFGGTWQATEQTQVGLWFRPQSTATDMEGSVDVDLSADLGAFVEGLEDILGEEFLDDPRSSYDFELGSIAFPRQAGMTVAHRFDNQDRFHAKFVWTDWSSTFSDWNVRLSNPSNPEFTGYLGGDGSVEVDLGLNWRDSIVLSAGYEADFGERLTLRGGLGWSNNPVRGSVFSGVAPYNTMHAALGATLWGGPQDLLDWHLALVAALPEKWTSGDNVVLSDLSRDEFDQQVVSVMFGCAMSW
ncbi:MAG: outer membrane protein transport protein [Planctomycetota bacterium]|jgi:long-subunit fatty acid transport protein|nr:outer membrane protein transport protein [Planctomycetota bacterium]